MPMYEYGCLSCAGRFDRLRPMGADDRGVTCPHCQSDTVRRRLSTFASHTRGAAMAAIDAAAEAVSAAPLPAASCGGGCSGCACGSRS